MAGIFGLLMSGAGVLKDQYFNLTSLLLPGNGTNGATNNSFVDSSTANSGTGWPITRNGDTTQGTFSPFSQTGWSNYYNGSGYFSSSTALFAYTTGNASTQTFTIEAMVYHTARTTPVFQPYSQCIAGKGNVYMNFGINGTGNLIFLHNDGTERIITSSSTVPLNSWTYVAIVVSGGTATMYINNSSVGSGTWYGIAAGAVSSTSYFGKAATAPDANVFQGYISNLRVSSTARTAAVPTSGYTNDGNTVFLFNSSNQFVDKSSNAYPITVVSTPSVTPFSPFAPTSSYSAAAVGGSGYFDGSADYLSLADNAAFDFGSGDFTIEMWTYLTGTSTAAAYRITGQNSSAVFDSDLSFSIIKEDITDKYLAYVRSGSTNYETRSSQTATRNAWVHIALVRSGGNLNQYINGQLDGQSTTLSTNALNNSTKELAIGRQGEQNSGYYLGYIANYRIVKGTAVYTGNFTPPSLAPLSTSGSASAAAYPSTTNVNTSFASSACSLLLNFTNAGVVDATAKNVLETEGSAQISTTQSKWGGGSIRFDGTSNTACMIAQSRWQAFGSTNFSIEMWFRVDALSGVQTLISQDWRRGIDGPKFTLFIGEASSDRLSYTANGGAISIIAGAGNAISANTWYFVQVIKSGGTTTLYLNGTSVGSAADTYTYPTPTYNTYIGRSDPGGSLSGYLTGYIDDLRITIGQARTAGTATAPFPLQ